MSATTATLPLQARELAAAISMRANTIEGWLSAMTDPETAALDVACPICGVAPGELCQDVVRGHIGPVERPHLYRTSVAAGCRNDNHHYESAAIRPSRAASRARIAPLRPATSIPTVAGRLGPPVGLQCYDSQQTHLTRLGT